MNFVHALSKRAGRLAVFLTIVALVVLVDQATKAAINLHIPEGTATLPIIPGVLGICHIENTGAAFSLGEGASPLFAVIAFVVLIACIVWVARDNLPLPLVFSLALVAGGGAGNMVDRFTSGSVTDFIATLFMRFPVFNVADICVTVGVAVSLVVYIWWEHQESARTAAQGDATPLSGEASNVSAHVEAKTHHA